MSDDAAATVPNHACLLTPAGTGAIATIRLVGPRVGAFLQEHFSRTATIGRAVHGELSDGAEVIDDPLVARIDEQVVDINVHGGSWVIERTLEIAAAAGFERASNHGLVVAAEAATEIEREVHESLPLARTEESVRSLLAQPAAWRRLIERMKASELRRTLDDRSLEWMLRLPRVAIIGPPNVGKSALANQLFATQRSITADQPGTTRDWVGEIANLDGLAVMLLDTPGVRTSDDEIEMTAIARAREQIESVDLVIVVEDGQQPGDPVVVELLKHHPTAVRVVNKMDRMQATPNSSDEAVFTNALTGEGVDGLRRKIRSRFGCETIDVTRPCCWTERQRKLIAALQ